MNRISINHDFTLGVDAIFFVIESLFESFWKSPKFPIDDPHDFLHARLIHSKKHTKGMPKE